MAGRADLLPPAVAAAATAIANARSARRGAPAITNVLDLLPEAIFDDLIDDARAVVAALESLPPKPRPAGALRAADASAIGLNAGLGSLCLLGRDRVSQPSGVLWAVGAGVTVLTRDQSEALWAAVTGRVRDLPHLFASPDHPESAP